MRRFVIEVDNADALDMHKDDILYIKEIEGAFSGRHLKPALHGESPYWEAKIVREGD
jgi:hypothetical protein